MKLSSVVTAAALASGMAGAMAANYSIGNLPIAPTVYTITQAVPPGPFSDLYSFVFPAGAVIGSGSAVSIDVASILRNTSDLQVSLLNASQAPLASGTVGDASVLFNQPMTVGSSYYFEVTGIATGASGGFYSFLASAAPVPEPEAFTMMLCGLAVVGSIVRRRRRIA